MITFILTKQLGLTAFFFRYMVDKVEQYNYKNVGFILDWGYFSKDDIQYMEDNGYVKTLRR